MRDAGVFNRYAAPYFLACYLCTAIFYGLFGFEINCGTIHETAMLFFSKDVKGESYSEAKGGNVIYFFGSLVSAGGIHSINVLAAIFLLTTFIYFVYVVYKLSKFMTIGRTVGLIIFEIIVWSVLISTIIYILLKLYNGVLASLPFFGIKKLTLPCKRLVPKQCGKKS